MLYYLHIGDLGGFFIKGILLLHLFYSDADKSNLLTIVMNTLRFILKPLYYQHNQDTGMFKRLYQHNKENWFIYVLSKKMPVQISNLEGFFHILQFLGID